MNLKDFQEAFLQRVLSPTAPQPWDDNLRAGGRLADANAVLTMHHRGYVARLTEALGQRYEGMWWVLGDDDFFAVCQDYIAAKPSRDFNLNFYGDDFPAWAAAHPRTEEVPFLEDLGRFEQAFFRLFHSADPKTASTEVLQSFLTQGDLALTFSPALELFESDFSVYELWQCRTRSAESEEPVPDWDKPLKAALYRSQGSVFVKTLAEEPFGLLKRLVAGESAAVLSEEAFDPAVVQELFAFLVVSGAVIGLKQLH